MGASNQIGSFVIGLLVVVSAHAQLRPERDQAGRYREEARKVLEVEATERSVRTFTDSIGLNPKMFADLHFQMVTRHAEELLAFNNILVTAMGDGDTEETSVDASENLKLATAYLRYRSYFPKKLCRVNFEDVNQILLDADSEWRPALLQALTASNAALATRATNDPNEALSAAMGIETMQAFLTRAAHRKELLAKLELAKAPLVNLLRNHPSFDSLTDWSPNGEFMVTLDAARRLLVIRNGVIEKAIVSTNDVKFNHSFYGEDATQVNRLAWIDADHVAVMTDDQMWVLDIQNERVDTSVKTSVENHNLRFFSRDRMYEISLARDRLIVTDLGDGKQKSSPLTYGDGVVDDNSDTESLEQLRRIKDPQLRIDSNDIRLASFFDIAARSGPKLYQLHLSTGQITAQKIRWKGSESPSDWKSLENDDSTNIAYYRAMGQHVSIVTIDRRNGAVDYQELVLPKDILLNNVLTAGGPITQRPCSLVLVDHGRRLLVPGTDGLYLIKTRSGKLDLKVLDTAISGLKVTDKFLYATSINQTGLIQLSTTAVATAPEPLSPVP